MPSGNPVVGSLFFPGRAKMRRRVRGKPRDDFDAVECFAFFFPLVPRRPVHVWGWGLDDVSGHMFSAKRTSVYSYRAMPIRWSPFLVVRALLRYWLWVPMVVGFLFSQSCAHGLLYRAAAFALFLGSLAAWLVPLFIDHGQANIRRLLGRHRLGVSDPATWTDDLVQFLAPPRDWFGTPTFAEAVELLLRDGRYGEAMWAARLCLAVEDKQQGRELTDRVLNHPGVRAVLSQIKARPERFKDFVNWRHPQPFPLVRPDKSRAGAFWQSVLDFQSTETFTFSTYSRDIRGVMAYGDDTDKRERERIRIGPRPPADQLGPHSGRYRLGGFALVAAVLVGVVAFAWASELFREMTPAEKMAEEERRRLAEKPPAPRRWTDREPGNWQDLADLPAFDLKEGPWKFANDGTMGNPERTPIKVGEFPSPRGLAMHPNANDYAAAKFRLGRSARLFKSAGALNDTCIVPHSPLVFEVWGDGKRLWRSEPLTGRAQFRECEVNVEDVDVLELRAVAQGFNAELHAVWLEPRLLMK